MSDQPIYRVHRHGIFLLATAINGTEWVAPLGTPPPPEAPGQWAEYDTYMSDLLILGEIEEEERKRGGER